MRTNRPPVRWILLGLATLAAHGLAAQQSIGLASPQQVGPTAQSFQGSIAKGEATDQALDLSLDDAIQRGLKANLGVILSVPRPSPRAGNGSATCRLFCLRGCQRQGNGDAIGPGR